MENKNVKYWDDLSQQEKDLAIAFGIENEYSHEKSNHDENLSYEKMEDVPEQAKELWDMMHNN